MNHKTAIETAPDLGSLHCALIEAEEACAKARQEAEENSPYGWSGGGIEQLYNLDISDLPTFGGDAPCNAMGAYSWDEESILTAYGSRWEIVSRSEWPDA